MDLQHTNRNTYTHSCLLSCHTQNVYLKYFEIKVFNKKSNKCYGYMKIQIYINMKEYYFTYKLKFVLIQ